MMKEPPEISHSTTVSGPTMASGIEMTAIQNQRVVRIMINNTSMRL